MEVMTFVVPCLFGLEGLAAEELRRLGLDSVQAENGRVLFQGGQEAMAMANLWLRTGERVLLRLAKGPARSFEELFQIVATTPLEEVIPRDGKFPVKGHSLNSQLHSVPDCQAIVKRAAAKRLGAKYGVTWLPETGELYQLQFSLMHDEFELFLDTTGPGLHKRGYRAVGNDAPLRETLAAGMVQLTRYRGRDFFWDPFCGSGTIPIEAALIAKNRAPGLTRGFAVERFAWIDGTLFPASGGKPRSGNIRGITAFWAQTTIPNASASPWPMPEKPVWAGSSSSGTPTPPKRAFRRRRESWYAIPPMVSGCWSSARPRPWCSSWAGT